MKINPFTLDRSAQHDQRYFAMFNNSVVVIGNPNFEGGNSQEALNYYQYIFNVNIKELPESLNLVCEMNTQLVILAVKQGLERLQELTQFIDNQIAVNGITLEASRAILEKIQKQCEAGACYFASGYKNKNAGHYASMKVRHKGDNLYAFSLINLGAGVEYHLVTEFNGDRIKHCYQSNEFEMDFTSQVTVEFMLHLLQLRYDKSLNNYQSLKEFSEDDLYGLLLIHGGQVVLHDKIELKSSTGQRAGCCTITNLHTAMRDIMVDHDCNSKQYKRYHFSMKLKSIMVAFNSFLDQQVSHTVFLWSLNELAVRINKHDALLTSEEMSFCTDLIFSLTEKVNKVKNEREKNAVLHLPPLSGVIKGYEFPILDLALIQVKSSKTKESTSTNADEYGQFVPERASEILELFFSKRAKWLLFIEESVIELNELLIKMQPCFSKETKKFWDQVSPEYLAGLFELLLTFSIFLKCSEESERTQTRFLVILKIYDLFTQLAPSFKNSNGDGFKLGDKYTFGLDDECFDKNNFNDPLLYKQAQVIQQRFKERAKGKKRIFTNCVCAQKNDFDATPYYLIHELMSEHDRNHVRSLKKEFEISSSQELDDFISFSVFMEDFENKWPGPEKRMQIDSIAKVAFPIQIAGAVYSGLMNKTKYIIDNENRIAYFSLGKNVRSCYFQTGNKSAIENSQRFPFINPLENTLTVSTFLENTIYYRDLLVSQTESGTKKDKKIPAVIPLIQTQISGSLNPYSVIWKPSPYQTSAFQLIDEELKHIECAPHLQVIRTLNWCCANFESLKYPEIRKSIREFIFKYSLLEQAIADQFESLFFQFSRFVAISSRSIQGEASENHELLIWLIQTIQSITQYIELFAPFYQIDLQARTIPDLIPLLKQQLLVDKSELHRQKLAALIITCFHNRPIDILEIACEFLIWRILANLGVYAVLSESTWAIHSKRIHQILISDKAKSLPLLSQLLNDYRVFNEERKWKFDQTDLISENVRINVLTGVLLTETSGVPKKCTEQVFANNGKLIEELGLKSQTVEIYYLAGDQSKLFTLDKEWEFKCENNGLFKIQDIRRKIVIEGVELAFDLEPHAKLQPFDICSFNDVDCSLEYPYFFWHCGQHPALYLVNRKDDPSIFYRYNATVVHPIHLRNQGFSDPNQFNEINAWKEIAYGCALIKDQDNKVWFIDMIPHRTRPVLIDQSKPDVKSVIESLKFSVISDFGMIDKVNKKNAPHFYLLASSIQQQIEQHRGVPPRAYTLIKEYKLKEKNSLRDTNQIYLNLFNTPNDFEKNWINYFGNYFDLHGLRCIARLDSSSKQHHILSIEHLKLKLSFNVTSEKQIESGEFPGYFLIPVDVHANQALANGIFLANKEGKKIVILPGYQLKRINSDDQIQNLFNKRILIDDENPYYAFSYEENSMSCINETHRVEASLYLSLVYACNNDYQSAINTLNDAHELSELSATSQQIIYMTRSNPANSPMYAAYCLKLYCYTKNHLYYWNKNFDTANAIVNDSWFNFIESQMAFYYQTVSQRRQNISILPAYLCLTEEELRWLSYHQSRLLARQFSKDSSIKLNNSQLKCLKNVNIFESLFNLISAEDNQSNIAEHYIVYNNNCDLDLYPKRLRMYSSTIRDLTGYITKYFDSLVKLALSSQNDDHIQLKKILFITLRSNGSSDGIDIFSSALLFVLMHREHVRFVGFEVSKESRETVKKLFSIISTICEEEKLASNYQLSFLKIKHILFDPKLNQTESCDYYKGKFIYRTNSSKPELVEIYEHPFKKVVDDYFTVKSTPIVSREFPLAIFEMHFKNPIERKLYDGYLVGHEANLGKETLTYRLNEDHSLKELAIFVNNKLMEIDNQVKAIESELFSINDMDTDNSILQRFSADRTNKLLLNIKLARYAGHKKIMTFQDILNAFQNFRTDYLAIQNPFLTAKQTQKTYTQLFNLLLAKSAQRMLNNTLLCLDNPQLSSEININSIATILNWKRLYNPTKLSDRCLLYFEFLSRKQFHQEQVKLLVKCFQYLTSDNSLEWHVWIQFPAGGGKTSVIIPTIIKQIDNYSKLPVLINTNELYHLSKVQMPAVLKNIFSIEMQVIELGIDHKWKNSELCCLYNNLVRWKRNSVCVLMTPDTWHSIFLTLKSAFFDNNQELANDAISVLDIFKEHSVKIEDELHLTSSALQLYIKTVGKSVPIPDYLFAILIEAYNHLLGIGKIASMSELRFGRKYPTSKSMLLALQKELANELIKQTIFSSLPTNLILDYWLQTEKTRPNWLIQLANVNISEQVESIVYVRAILHTHLPRLLLLKKDKDYGKSTHRGDFTAAPKHECKDVTSHFADYTMVAALTIQLHHQNGLTPSQAADVLNLLRKEHLIELGQFQGVLQTPAEALVTSCVKDVNSLSELTTSVKEKICNSPQFCNHKQVINKYLLNFALKQIRFSTERLASTAADFKFGFNKSYSFSATPGLEEMYPASSPHDYFILDTSFESLVIHRLLSPANRHFSFIQDSENEDALLSPAEFFKKLDPELLKTITTLIDRGGLLTDFTTEHVIQAYLKCNHLQVSSQSAAFFAQDTLHLNTNDKNVKPFVIKGADLTAELIKQGIDPENFVLFLFLDLSKTTGTDIRRPHQDKAGLTVGQNQTMTETIQAAMRERKLLESDAQTITWLMFKSLYQHLAGCDVFDPYKLFAWLIKNEACDFESKIINRTYQGIYHILSYVAWSESVFVDNAKDKTWFDFTFKEALRETVTFSPWSIYELPSTRENTRTVLENYVNELKIKRFRFAEFNIAISDKVNHEIQAIIDRTVELIPEMESPPKYSLDLEVQQETQVEIDVQEDQFLQQTQRLHHNLQLDNFTFAIENYRFPQDDLPQLTQYPILTLPGCAAIKIPKISFSKAHFSVTNQVDSQSENDISELKAIKMFVVQISPDKSCQYLICTAAGGEFYYHRILQVTKDTTQFAYLLVSSEGQILTNSKNITWEEATQILATKSLQEIVTFINLLNGQIPNTPNLAELIKAYQWTKEDFTRISSAIHLIHVSKQTVLLETNPALENLSGWTKKACSTNSSPFFQTHTKSAEVQAQYALTPDQRYKNFNVKLAPSSPTQPIKLC